ncbi:hypothetical protein TNCV_3781631 [Trichonephila clavipes]|nr:hypothetical protein TNCV_3781631 [Trichonephila clavipes]
MITPKCISSAQNNLNFTLSNPGEGTDVGKCTVPSRHGVTLNSRRAASPLVRLGGTEQNHTASCMVLKAKANDRIKNLALHREEFREPGSDVNVNEVA